MPLTLQFTVRSDTGLVREANEDSVYAAPHLLVVADGMGGHAGGEVASSLAVSHMARLRPVTAQDDPAAALRAVILEGNSAIAQAVRDTPDLEGMGTTITAVLLEEDSDRFVVANVGDSRTYLMRADELVLLTRDDSLVQSLLDAGRITAAEAATHPQRSMVTKALVGDEDLEPSLTLLETRPGDRFLLCSDGLTDLVGEPDLATAMQSPSREEAADRLVALALDAGGHDNVSVVVADVVLDQDGTAAMAPWQSVPEHTTSPAQERRGRVSRFMYVLAGVALIAAAAAYLLG
ncbi:PP2C family protein-serine/threonine phosphatase [Streptomyces echinatus]|uniref:PP2C family protein-serine/threonine phosphatase n=1 Tax=Streptomyces echinatus TaxID=67293 RepID=UPI0037B528D0